MVFPHSHAFFSSQALLENLADEFYAVMKKHRLPQGDFPPLARFKEVASTYDFGKVRRGRRRGAYVIQHVVQCGCRDSRLLRDRGAVFL